MLIRSIRRAVIKRYTDPHGALPWRELSLPDADCHVRPVPIPATLKGGSIFSRLIEYLLKACAHYLAFVDFSNELSANKNRILIAREFLTIPTFIFSPTVYKFRKRLIFLCNHNIAAAKRSLTQRLMLKILARLGYRFGCFESSQGWIDIVDRNAPHKQLTVFLHPCNSRKNYKPTNLKGSLTFSFLGALRDDRAIEPYATLLQRWAENEGMNVSIVVGVPQIPNIEERGKYNPCLKWIETRDRAQYEALLQSTDFAIFAYDANQYAYRPSGILSECLEFDVVPIVRDIPGIIDQIRHPVEVGVSFKDEDGFVNAVKKAIALLAIPEFERKLDNYRNCRAHSNFTKNVIRFE